VGFTLFVTRFLSQSASDEFSSCPSDRLIVGNAQARASPQKFVCQFGKCKLCFVAFFVVASFCFAAPQVAFNETKLFAF